LEIHLQKPADSKHFLDTLEALRTIKRKAPNLLFEEIEHDIIDKEKFVSE
jgi:hypothetical protein